MAVHAQLQRRAARPLPLIARLSESREAYPFLLPALIILLGFVAWPFVDGILTSMSNRGVARPGTFTGFANFDALLHDEIYTHAVAFGSPWRRVSSWKKRSPPG